MISNRTLNIIKSVLNFHQSVSLLPYKMAVHSYFYMEVPVTNRWLHITKISILFNTFTMLILTMQLYKFYELDIFNVMFAISIIAMVFTITLCQLFMIFSYNTLISLMNSFLEFNKILGEAYLK